MEKKIFYRVIPEFSGYATMDFESLEDAINKANERNKIRIDETNSSEKDKFIWYGDNCKIVKVTEITEFISISEINKSKSNG